jgi:hypothetical protein
MPVHACNAGVDTRCPSLIVRTRLAERLELRTQELNVTYRTAAREGQELPARGIANLTFELEESKGLWLQFREQYRGH